MSTMISLKEETLKRFQKFKPGSLVWKVFRFFLLLGICYIFLFPVLYMISIAVRSPEAVNDPTSIWIPHQLSWESIKMTMKMLRYWESLGVTVVMTFGGTIASLISCSLVGYGFARYNFWGKKLVFGFLILTIIVPPQTIVISSFVNFKYFNFFGIMKLLHMALPFVPGSINLINTPWTFILPSLFATGLRAGLFVFIFRQFFSGMPKDLEEAARIDGCGALKTYVQIMLPLAKSAIITVMLFSFIWHWNDFYLSAIFYNDKMPISVMLSQIKSFLQNEKLVSATSTPDQIRTYLQAGCLLTILPPLVVYTITQKFFTESIERTGIVG